MFCTELFESQDFVVVVVVMKKLLKPQDRLLKSSESKAISLKTTCGLGSKYIKKTNLKDTQSNEVVQKHEKMRQVTALNEN